MSSRFERRSNKPSRSGRSEGRWLDPKNSSGAARKFRGRNSEKRDIRGRQEYIDDSGGEKKGANKGLYKKGHSKNERIQNPVEKDLDYKKIDSFRARRNKPIRSNASQSLEGSIRSRSPINRRSVTSHEPFYKNNVGEVESFSSPQGDDLIWGRHSAQAVLESKRPIHRIWCTSELRSSSKFLQLLREAKSAGVLVEEVTWARLGQLTKGAVHQGIVLQIAACETLDITTILKGCEDLDEPPLLLALDGLKDPHNLGAIARSAEALGAHGLVVPQRRSAGLTGTVAKVAAGALEHLPVARVVNLNRSLNQLKDAGYTVVGLAEEGDTTLLEADLHGPLVLVTGSEEKGISLLTRKHCDFLIRIPLRGITASLNASVATSIVLYEVARQGWMNKLRGQCASPRMARAKFTPQSNHSNSDDSPKGS